MITILLIITTQIIRILLLIILVHARIRLHVRDPLREAAGADLGAEKIIPTLDSRISPGGRKHRKHKMTKSSLAAGIRGWG